MSFFSLKINLKFNIFPHYLQLVVTMSNQLIGMFNRLSAFNDKSLIAEAKEHIMQISSCEELDEEVVKYVMQCMVHTEQSESVQEMGCSVLAIAVGSDSLQNVIIEGKGVGIVLKSMDVHFNNRDVQYQALDVLSTVAANSSQARDQLSLSSCTKIILKTLKNFPHDLDIQLGAACTLAGSAMNSPQNVSSICSCDGLNTLIKCYRNAFIHRKTLSDWKQVEQWSAIALKNIIRCQPENMKSANFGRFGEYVAVDELKWELTLISKIALRS